MATFAEKLAQLRNDLVTQGDRVVEMVLWGVEAYFESDHVKAKRVVDGDDLIDRVDVEIERASIPLLAMGVSDEHDIRSVLTVVKINNELERIADCAVSIAQVVLDGAGAGNANPDPVPPVFRVMANSVVGMLQDANRALATLDLDLASKVLGYDDTVDRFRTEIVLDAQKQVAGGAFSALFAFRLLTVTKSFERIADHCTNICEQLIYLESGKTVRHLPQGWTSPAAPEV